MKVRQVADGLLESVRPKPSISSLRSNISREKAVVTSKSGPVTLSMRDKPPVGATYKMRMNEFVAPNIGLGLDGQTKAYIKPNAKEAKAIFASKYVPFTDGTQLLTGANKKTMSQYGYGAVPCSSLPSAPKVRRIGFNNTLADTTGGKITESLAPVRKYLNNAVYTDFPKGPGGASPNKLWVDGTYEDTMAAIHKKQDEGTKDLDLTAPRDIRKEVFQQQALAGAQVYGDELLKQNLEDEFAAERAAQIQSAARASRPHATEEEIAAIGRDVAVARRAGLIERQLRLPAGSPIAEAAAVAEIAAEQERSDRTAEIGVTIDEHAAARRAQAEVAREGAAHTGASRRAQLVAQLLAAHPGVVAQQLGIEEGLSVRGALELLKRESRRSAEAIGVTEAPAYRRKGGRERSGSEEEVPFARSTSARHIQAAAAEEAATRAATAAPAPFLQLSRNRPPGITALSPPAAARPRGVAVRDISHFFA